jgi:hypothetical protein
MHPCRGTYDRALSLDWRGKGKDIVAKAKRSIAKSDFIQRNLEIALEKLAVASAAGDRAVSVRSRDSKKIAATVKRLAKRKSALLKRRVSAKKRAKRSPSGDTRKALRSVLKELAGTTKALTKARSEKAAGATELAALKTAARRATGYSRAIARIDRALGRGKT